MAFGEPDIDAMLEDMGVPVIHGVTEAKGLVDIATTDLAESEGPADLHGTLLSVLVRTSRFPAVASGDTISVDGADYRIVHLQRVDDGALLRIHCAETQ